MIPDSSLRLARNLALILTLLSGVCLALPAAADVPVVKVVTDESGSRLQVDGEDFMVLGMNWGYMPIGQNYTYDFWGQPDAVIEAALEKEMSLLKGMGVNVIRQYTGISPRWVEYIYDNYGIWTVLNHTMGRYGLTLDGVWIPSTDYSDPRVIDFLRGEMAALAEQFKDTRGMLMWLLGNENNYGLHWSSFEIEALPEDQRWGYKARFLYKLMGTVIDDLHRLDPQRPVSMANGDLGYIDIIAEECQGLDIFGTNVYRGLSVRDMYQEVQDKMGIPVMFTEFGADAFNAITMKEDQYTQARFLLAQWQEIYEQSAGKGRVGNAIGGMTFQWSDGWWKYQQDANLSIHDINASWPNAGYYVDYREGDNNMNEEWWGICAKGPTDTRGIYDVYPRAAYFALRDAYRLDPYGPGTDLDQIRGHFGSIHPMGSVTEAYGATAAAQTDQLSKVRVSGVRMEFETYSTGGKNISTPPIEEPQDNYPSYLGFDDMQSFYVDFEARPNEAIRARMSLNILGNVAVNPIDEIFYENRGQPRAVTDANGDLFELQSLDRVKIYQADVAWDDRLFQLNGFYRTGHLHWQYEGDFFGLYRDAYYGQNIDIYNGEAPLGAEIAFKKELEGLKLAFGSQLWWGANPAIIAKYQRKLGGINFTGMFQEDFAQSTSLTSSVAIPELSTRKASLAMVTRVGPFNFEGGAIWSGQPREGEEFQIIDEDLVNSGDMITPEEIKVDTVKPEDTWGFKGKLTLSKGRWNWYGQGAYYGLVAESGPTAIPTFTGWNLKDSGSGNQVNALTGVTYGMGNWQIGPNFLYQKPIVGPMPHSDQLAGTVGRPRNRLADPFSVRGNRETTGGEIMLVFDPTPATWMWTWDSDTRENASTAASLSFVYKRHHTTADAGLFISAEDQVYAFPGATPARDLWDVHCRVVNNFGKSARMISHLYFGLGEPNGDNERLLHRYGLESRVAWTSWAVAGHVKFNDWGPYDYHRDHNLTFPVQLMADVSFTLGKPLWFDLHQTMIGVRGAWRSLDSYSNRYMPEGYEVPDQGVLYPEDAPDGQEWEIRTYVKVSI